MSILFVKFVQLLTPTPKSKIMFLFRKIHNIILSLLSLLMFLGIFYSNVEMDKFSSVNNLLCKSYQNNYNAHISVNMFLYSKYLEWFDTLFLHLSGKKISSLQYTHHMSTAILVYINLIDYISPHMFIFMGMNCFVHILM